MSKTRERQRGDRVRTRILVPFTFVILSVIGAFLVTAYLYEEHEHEENLTESVAAVERLFRQTLDKDSNMLLAALTAIAHDDGIKTAFLDGDRAALLKRAGPLFKNLRRNNLVTHFYFTGPDRVNFLRVHQPDEYGDAIDRITMLWAAEARVIARGIELGPLGTFTLRVVMPWYDGERLIGYLELGEEIDHIATEVHRVFGADLLVLVYERFLDTPRWETGRRMLGHQDDWRRFGSTLVVGRAMQKIPDALAAILERDEQPHEGALRLVEDGRNLFVAFMPLIDIAGRAVGNIVIVRDVTVTQAGFRNSMISIAALSVLAGSLVFAVFFAILGRVERDYRRQREVELQLSRVNTEHQRVVQVEKLSAMGLMIGEIAHQLNNPLVGVVNMVQLAEREIDDPERLKELLVHIGEAGKDCHAFVKRMLEFTKISCFDRKPTDMNVLVQETVSLFQESTGNQSAVKIELPQDAPTLDIDPVLVRHAVFNLLSNAAQANPPDGTITVSLRPEAQRQDRAIGWRIEIRDEGPGLSDGLLDKIFTPFFTTRAEGTGLGLPVVQHVAILHEGWITAGNAEGGGALFALYLPDTGNGVR